MATFRLPTPPQSSFVFIVRLFIDGIPFRFQYRWNSRNTSWVLDIGGSDGVAIVRNLKMTIGTDILAPHRALEVPQGNLRVVDTAKSGVEPTREEFGGRVLLLYDEPTGTENDPQRT
jgi:hypothetical protein